jgi:small-conductance mechanosensitive channel
MIATKTTAAGNTTQPVVTKHFQLQFQGIVTATIGWFQDHWLQILIAAGAAAVIVAILYTLRRYGAKLCKPGRPTGSWATIIGRAVSKTTNYFIIMIAVRLVSGYADPPPTVAHLIQVLTTIAVVLQFAIWAREIILGAIEHRTSAEHYHGEAIVNAMGLIRLLVGVIVFAIAIVVLLGNLGVNVTGLVAGLGVGGIAIGLAAQGIFADLFAALAIIFDRPFGKGDGVNVDGNFGVIDAIGLKSTRIRLYTGEMMVISNKNLLDKIIVNLAGRQKIRTKYTIGVAYETPVETLERLPTMLKELVESVGGEASRSGFDAFGGSSLDHAVWIDTPGADWALAHGTRDKFLIAVMKKFEEEGITIAYPTQTTYTAAPDGTIVMPYPEVQPVKRVDLTDSEKPAGAKSDAST